jgi:hypothetical protein
MTPPERSRPVIGKDTGARPSGAAFPKNKKAALGAAFRNNFLVEGVVTSVVLSAV